MKKLFTIMAIMALTAVGASAQIEQKTVRGVVLDTNGNPIAGAEVMAPGGGASAITDADGSFSMTVSPYLKTLTATYAGMGSKKMKVRFDKDMVFNMKSAWKSRGFISLIGNVAYNEDLWDSPVSGGGGIMGGLLGKWGVYGKVTMSNKKEVSATAGLIKGIIPALYFYIGVGYGSVADEGAWYDYFDERGYIHWEYLETKTHHNNGGALDFGFIIKPAKHFGFSVGFNGASSFQYNFRLGGDLGISYIF